MSLDAELLANLQARMTEVDWRKQKRLDRSARKLRLQRKSVTGGPRK